MSPILSTAESLAVTRSVSQSHHIVADRLCDAGRRCPSDHPLLARATERHEGIDQELTRRAAEELYPEHSRQPTPGPAAGGGGETSGLEELEELAEGRRAAAVFEASFVQAFRAAGSPAGSASVGRKGFRRLLHHLSFFRANWHRFERLQPVDEPQTAAQRLSARFRCGTVAEFAAHCRNFGLDVRQSGVRAYEDNPVPTVLKSRAKGEVLLQTGLTVDGDDLVREFSRLSCTSTRVISFADFCTWAARRGLADKLDAEDKAVLREPEAAQNDSLQVGGARLKETQAAGPPEVPGLLDVRAAQRGVRRGQSIAQSGSGLSVLEPTQHTEDFSSGSESGSDGGTRGEAHGVGGLLSARSRLAAASHKVQMLAHFKPRVWRKPENWQQLVGVPVFNAIEMIRKANPGLVVLGVEAASLGAETAADRSGGLNNLVRVVFDPATNTVSSVWPRITSALSRAAWDEGSSARAAARSLAAAPDRKKHERKLARERELRRSRGYPRRPGKPICAEYRRVGRCGLCDSGSGCVGDHPVVLTNGRLSEELRDHVVEEASMLTGRHSRSSGMRYQGGMGGAFSAIDPVTKTQRGTLPTTCPRHMPLLRSLFQADSSGIPVSLLLHSARPDQLECAEPGAEGRPDKACPEPARAPRWQPGGATPRSRTKGADGGGPCVGFEVAAGTLFGSMRAFVLEGGGTCLPQLCQ